MLCREPGGSLGTHADLPGSRTSLEDIMADERGNAYVNSIGFDFLGGQFAPGLIAPVTPDGAAREVADGLAFPNGMAISPDGATLIVAESSGNRLTAYDIGREDGLGGHSWRPPGRDLRGLRGRRLLRRRRQPALRPGA